MTDWALAPLKKGHYKVILADPPWQFQAWSHRGEDRGAVQHYDCMSLQDICNLPVGDLAAEDCALFLWVVQPMLPEAMRVIESWGFKFKTVAFAWIKMPKTWGADGDGRWSRVSPRMGLGYYTRSGMEQCWLATKGSPKLAHPPTESRVEGAKGLKGIKRVTVPQVIHAPLREHSRKPDEVARSINKLFGDVSRCELFAREHNNGWESWGEQVGKF